MIAVVEVWQLRPELTGRALELMQEMDDLLEDNAHGHPGWCGHARFYASADEPGRVLMIYPWRSREQLDDLVRAEEPLLADFVARCCTRPREVHVYAELPVDVEPAGADPAGSGPAGSGPAGSEPAGSEPAGSEHG